MAGIILIGGSCNKTSDGADNPLFNSKSQPSSEQSAQFLIDWWKALFQFVATERLSPPDASRMFAYISVSLYEAQIAGASEYRTLEGQLNGLENLPRPEKGQVYDWPTCAIEATYLVQDGMLARYFPAGVSTLNKLYDEQIDNRTEAGVAQDVIDRSKEYGKVLADAILAWSEKDGYVQTRYKQYKAPSREGHPEYWEPTDFNQTALEPFWREHRTFCVKNGEQCDIDKAPKYVPGDTTSELYKQAKKVWLTDKTLTEEQRTIAVFWSDDASETSTPPGHWMEILGDFVKSQDMNLAQASELYALVSTAMADACITVWNTKYRVNLVRPKTVIRENFEPQWEPYVETPPFSGYTSGHSGFSGAAATIMTALIGDNLEFVDSSHVSIGLLPRNFKSFNDAAQEAAYSRMYGGIHFDCDINDGLTEGNCVGAFVLENIITHPKRQGDAKATAEKAEKKEN